MASTVYEFAGQPDFELNSDRSHPVSMIVETPDTEMADGLVFVIPGMGGEKDKHYSEMIRRYIASKHNLVVVSVDAHCSTCRPNCSTEFGDVTIDIEPTSIVHALGHYVSQGGVVDVPLQNHNDVIALLKRDLSMTFKLKATLEPPGGQYQNFGVLAALDHLAALHFLIDKGHKFDTSNVICIGSSHGGYIAHMMHKLAPNTINGIIDASAYTETVPSFIDGKWTEFDLTDGNFTYECSTTQKWQFVQPGEPTFFGPDRALIRDTVYDDHLAVIADASSQTCQFRMIHSTVDRVSSPYLKARQRDLLKARGFDVRLDVIGEADVDGKLIKSADHGMGIALNLLFDRYYPTMSRKVSKNDRERGTELIFQGPKLSYALTYRQGQIHADATCSEIDISEIETPTTSQIAS